MRLTARHISGNKNGHLTSNEMSNDEHPEKKLSLDELCKLANIWLMGSSKAALLTSTLARYCPALRNMSFFEKTLIHAGLRAF